MYFFRVIYSRYNLFQLRSLYCWTEGLGQETYGRHEIVTAPSIIRTIIPCKSGIISTRELACAVLAYVCSIDVAAFPAQVVCSLGENVDKPPIQHAIEMRNLFFLGSRLKLLSVGGVISW